MSPSKEDARVGLLRLKSGQSAADVEASLRSSAPSRRVATDLAARRLVRAGTRRSEGIPHMHWFGRVDAIADRRGRI